MKFIDYEILGSITLTDYIKALERFNIRDKSEHGMQIVQQIFCEEYME